MSQNSDKTKDLFSHLFSESRSYWWNCDFLSLIAKRWELKDARKVLDVGCGTGDWSRALAPNFNNETLVYGIDIDLRYLQKAIQLYRNKNSKIEFQFINGKVEDLAFQESSFDIATCQSLLIHVENIEIAIAEMLRVLKPGGRIIIAEPLKMIPMISCNPQLSFEMIDEYFDSVKFELICHRGKYTLGDGSMSATDDLVDILLKLGVNKIESYLSDKISLMTPPFSSPEEKSWISDLKNNYTSDIIDWSKDQTKKYFVAGGGDANDFDRHWKRAREDTKLLIDHFQNHTESFISSKLMCLISGIKPL
ncbi:MAG: class I SAM-dependent methyltransferase [Gammaproteobacteria bacterium]